MYGADLAFDESDQVFMYIMDEKQQGLEDYFMLQSYLDQCVLGCLGVGVEFAADFLRSIELGEVCIADNREILNWGKRRVSSEYFEAIDDVIRRYRVDLVDRRVDGREAWRLQQARIKGG